MEFGDSEIMGLDNFFRLIEALIPYTKTGSWSSNIGPLGSSRA